MSLICSPRSPRSPRPPPYGFSTKEESPAIARAGASSPATALYSSPLLFINSPARLPTPTYVGKPFPRTDTLILSPVPYGCAHSCAHSCAGYCKLMNICLDCDTREQPRHPNEIPAGAVRYSCKKLPANRRILFPASRRVLFPDSKRVQFPREDLAPTSSIRFPPRFKRRK